MSKSIQHILVIRLSAMGDVAMSVPVISAFVSCNPTVRVTVLTRAFFSPFFEDIPNVSVFAPDLKATHKGFLGIRRLAKELSELKIDAVADFHDVLRSNILIQLLRLKGVPFKQIDKGRAEKKALTRATKKVFRPLKTTHSRYAQVFKELGFQLDLSACIKPVKHTLAPAIWQYIGDTEKQLIGVAPFAAHKGKMYPLKEMEQVIEKLSKNYHVLLFGGGKDEREALENIAAKHSNVVNVAGQFSFKEELAIISNLNLMLAMDSSNGHLAAMYGVKVITIWGATHPYAGFAPFNQPEANQILPDLTKYPLIPTSIYGNKCPESYLDCFETISVNDVVSKIENALK
ncbi:MAG: glycosyltransferase family 9 protein, partial [Flavobacteriaceae bacterium]